jgi:hypothetical protein
MEHKELKNLVQRVKAGDHVAAMKLLVMFNPLIKKNSYINGVINGDCMQELSIKLLKSVKKFEFNTSSTAIFYEKISKDFCCEV